MVVIRAIFRFTIFVIAIAAIVIILGAGLSIIFLAVFVERQRERIIARTQELREVLDTWE